MRCLAHIIINKVQCTVDQAFAVLQAPHPLKVPKCFQVCKARSKKHNSLEAMSNDATTLWVANFPLELTFMPCDNRPQFRTAANYDQRTPTHCTRKLRFGCVSEHRLYFFSASITEHRPTSPGPAEVTCLIVSKHTDTDVFPV